MNEKEFLARFLEELGVEDNDVSYGDGLVLKIDGSAASTSKLPFQSWSDFGYRAVAGSYSDLRVKFVTEAYLLASVTAPDIETVREILQGILEASRRFGLRYIGGDLNQGREAVVDIALVGRSSARIGRRPQPGDVLITIPLFGYTSLGYRLWHVEHPAVRRGVEMLRRPDPTWPLPPSQCITASMDSSDGLADVLWTMARGVDIRVTELPTTDEVAEAAARFGLDLDEIVFNGGEEYLPIFAVRPECRIERPYVKFAEVVSGSGAVWWRGETLKWRGWAYF